MEPAKFGTRPKKKTLVQLQFKPKTNKPNPSKSVGPTHPSTTSSSSLCPFAWPPLHRVVPATSQKTSNPSPILLGPSNQQLLNPTSSADNLQMISNLSYMKVHPPNNSSVLSSDSQVLPGSKKDNLITIHPLLTESSSISHSDIEMTRVSEDQITLFILQIGIVEGQVLRIFALPFLILFIQILHLFLS